MKLFKKIYELDKIKYLPPKFETAFRELAQFIVHNKDELLEKETTLSSSSQFSHVGFIRNKKYFFY